MDGDHGGRGHAPASFHQHPLAHQLEVMAAVSAPKELKYLMGLERVNLLKIWHYLFCMYDAPMFFINTEAISTLNAS